MNKSLCMLPALICYCHSLVAASDRAATAAIFHQNAALVNTFALLNNQGAAGFLEHRSFALDISSSYFPLPIRSCSAAAAFPFAHGLLGATLLYTGTSYYHRIEKGLVFASRLHPSLGLGLALRYKYSNADAYRSGHILTASTGILCRISLKFDLGIRVESPMHYAINGKRINHPSPAVHIGMRYQPAPELQLSMQAINQLGNPFNLKAGLTYLGKDTPGISLAYSVRPSMITAGISFRLGRQCFLAIASDYQPALGFRTNAALNVLWSDKTKDSHTTD